MDAGPGTGREPAPKRELIAGAGWFAVAVAFYMASSARGLVWADASKLTLYAVSGTFPSLNPGDHAGWTVLAWAWLRLLGGDPVVATHRFSAVCGALVPALAVIWLLRRRHSPEAAHTAASILLVAHPLWWASTVAETYAPAMAATLGGAVVLGESARRWRLILAGSLWGLALAVHGLSVFLIVPLAWLHRPRGPSWVLTGLAVGSSPMWLAFWWRPLDPLTGLAAAGSASWEWHVNAFLALSRMPRGLLVLAALLVLGWGPVAGWLMARGVRFRDTAVPWRWSLVGLTLVLSIYAPFRLHLMVGFLLTGMVLACAPSFRLVGRIAHIGVQVVVYAVLPLALSAVGRGDLGVRQLPFRDNASYFLWPVKTFDRGPERYLEELSTCAPPAAAVLADFNPGAVLRLAQVVRGWRTDLAIKPVAVDLALGTTDPGAALAAEVRPLLGRGQAVVFADRWEPYYRISHFPGDLAAEACAVGARLHFAER
ncbi:MAG: hypothetical protein ACOY3Y_14820 [Acidobacteriota bacterium]